MSIRPIDLPELRAEAILHQASDGAIMKVWANGTAHPDLPKGHPGRSADFARSMWRRELERLGSADLYFVCREMTQLATEAAKSIPSFQIHATDLPSRNGLIFYEGGLRGGMVHHDGTPQDTQAVLLDFK